MMASDWREEKLSFARSKLAFFLDANRADDELWPRLDPIRDAYQAIAEIQNSDAE